MRLWARTIDDAVSYIWGLPERNVKDTAAIEETMSWREKERLYISGYTLWPWLGYRAADRDSLVTNRQRNKGMSWSGQGSVSPASTTALIQNQELEDFLRHRTVTLQFR